MNYVFNYKSFFTSEHSAEELTKNGDYDKVLLFTEVIQIRQRMAKAICGKYLYNSQHTDDVLQEVYLKLFINIQTTSQAWTYHDMCQAFIGYTKYMCKSFNERRQRFLKRRYELTNVIENRFGMIDYTPEELLTEREHKFLDEQICNLPQEDMLLLVGYLDNDLKIYDTAVAVDMPVSKTKERIKFLINKLRDNISDPVLKEFYESNQNRRLANGKPVMNTALVAEMQQLSIGDILSYALKVKSKSKTLPNSSTKEYARNVALLNDPKEQLKIIARLS